MASLSTLIYIFVIIINTSKGFNVENDTQWRSNKLVSKDGWTAKAEDFLFPSVVYSMCKDEALKNTSYECIIVVQKDFQDDVSKASQCQFTLDQASNGIVRVKIFGSDKVIFVWAHEMKDNEARSLKFKTGVIDMSSCKIYDTGLVLQNAASKSFADGILQDVFHIGLLTHHDTFDVIVKGLQACENDNRLCVYMYDSYGKKIKGPVTL